jgi:hypothetical protein
VVHGLVRSVELLNSIDELGFRGSFFSQAGRVVGGLRRGVRLR